jgi:hypothetical protein
MTTKEQLKVLLAQPAPADDLLAQIRRSPSVKPLLEAMRTAYPDLGAIPQTTYTRYRQFEFTGERDGYQTPYFAKRSMLTRGVLEMILGDDSTRDAVHDLLWSICGKRSSARPGTGAGLLGTALTQTDLAAGRAYRPDARTGFD